MSGAVASLNRAGSKEEEEEGAEKPGVGSRPPAGAVRVHDPGRGGTQSGSGGRKGAN